MSNGYRMFEKKHIYQVRICSLVFGGFVNKRLRKISMGLIFAAREWDLGGYQTAAADYLRAAIKTNLLAAFAAFTCSS